MACKVCQWFGVPMTTASMDLSSRTFVYSVAIAGRLPVPCRVLHPYPEERFFASRP